MKMKDESIFEKEDFKKCIEFHGHICGGLAIGYVASKAGLQYLREKRSLDEELVTIVENDACCVDAVQVLTGCTFGKGNFIFRDFGKMAFTFFSRKTGAGVRVAMKSQPVPQSKSKKDQKGNTKTDSEQKQDIARQIALEILSTPVDDMFELTPVKNEIPEKARIEPSIPCRRCGEPTMASRLKRIDGESVCMGCIAT